MSSQKSTGVAGKKGRTPKFARGLTRVAALKEAGSAVIAEKGYDAATMTEIAERAGASIGSLYQFFPTKAALAAELHRECLQALSKTMGRTRSPGKNAAQLSQILLLSLTDFLAQRPEFPELSSRADVDKAQKKQARLELRGKITEVLGGADPPLTGKEAETAAVVILEMMKAAVGVLRTDGRKTQRTVLQAFGEMLTCHLSPR